MGDIIPLGDQPKERIVSAANKYPHITIVGPRHFDETMCKILSKLNPEDLGGEPIQGFITNFGQFLTHEEAWVVAERAGQIIRRVGGDTINGGRLFSENLY